MVLTNDLPYVRSVIEEAGVGTWYDSSHLSTFADAVNGIVENPELLRRCQEKARLLRNDTLICTAELDELGTFVLDDLAPGTYQLALCLPDREVIVEAISL